MRLSVEPLVIALKAAGFDVEPGRGHNASQSRDEDGIRRELSKRHKQAIAKARFNGYFALSMVDEICCKVLRAHPSSVYKAEYERVVWWDIDPDPSPIAQVIALPVVQVVEVETRTLVAA